MQESFDYRQQPGRILNNRFSIKEVKPLISIITPYYNSGRYFEQTFNCVLNQTFPYFEWIIVNDKRTDENNRKILEDLALKDIRIRIYNTEELSISQARNFAIKNANTDIIVPLDSDDLIEPIYIECLYWALKSNPEASWAYTDSITFHDKEFFWQQDFNSLTMKKENILIYSAAIRKEVINEVNGYTELDKHFFEDWHFWLKLLACRKFPVRIKNCIFWYRSSNTGALARVLSDAKLKKESEKVINEQAKKVPDNIEAITFNGTLSKEFIKPYKWEWDDTLEYSSKKIRLLMIIPHMEMGGADKFNIDIVSNINKEKFEIGIITTNPANNELRQQFSQYVEDIFELPTFLDRNEWNAFIYYFIKSRKVDIVLNISSYYGYHIIPWLRKELPHLALVDCVHAEGKYWRSGGYPRLSAALDAVLDKTFVTNEFTRNIMVEEYGKTREKTHVIYTGVDENVFDTTKIESDGVKANYGIPEKSPIVLYLCRIAAEKRPFLMLEIAREVRKKIKNICFVVVGGGPQLAELREKVEIEGLGKTIIILDKQDDIKPFYKICDLLLICSIKEGLAITTFEAMAMGKPVISSNVGSQYELVSDKTGKLVECRQDEEDDFNNRKFSKEEIYDFVTAICDLLNDRNKLNDLGHASREKVLNGFTLKTLIDTLEKEFIALCDSNLIEKRGYINRKLNDVDYMVDDYLSLYNAYESKELETVKLWRENEWYRMQENRLLSYEGELSDSQAALKLRQIYNLRSWKLIQIYHKFIDISFIGRIIRMLRNKQDINKK